jgi:ATP-dependent Clp protease ATP-binding subunit ClpA
LAPEQPLRVWKYLELADRFISVRVLDPEEADLRAGPEMDRAAYRRAVIRACVEDFRADLPAKLEALHPGAPQAAADLLYQLCVAVNPDLDIHAVSLRGEEDSSATTDTDPAPARAPEESDPLRHLRARARGLEAHLLRRVVGQDEAVRSLVRAVRRGAAGLAQEGRPLGCFAFVGRTGTGKTELARALADEVFGAEMGLVRIDCSEFALAHEYAKLLGAPPGYVGHQDGGVLTEALLKEPRRVVLFDEVEKAHPRMHALLLQVLEDGRLTDGRGREVRFDRALVVLTSNAGAGEVAAAGERVGFTGGAPDEVEAAELYTRALRSRFAPELLGRIDETVVFRDLMPADARKIAARQLADLARRVRRRRLRVAFSAAVAGWIAGRGFCLESGAREIRRVVRREIEAPLADLLLAGARGRYRCAIRDGRPRFARAS